MTRERIDELVSLVLEARGKKGFSVSISIEMYDEEIYVFTDKAQSGITSTLYTTYKYYKADDKRVIRNGAILHVYDPDLKEAEKHIRRLLK